MDIIAKRKLMKFWKIVTEIAGILLLIVGALHIIFNPIIGLLIFFIFGLILLYASIMLKAWSRNLDQNEVN